MSFESEPLSHRSGACEIAAFLDIPHMMKCQNSHNSQSGRSFYPSSTSEETYNVRNGDLVFSNRETNRNDHRLVCYSSLAGDGAEENVMYPDDPTMVKMAILSKMDFVGVCVRESNTQVEGKHQGFVVALAGTAQISLKPGEIYAPGQNIVVELCENDANFSSHAKVLPSGVPLSKYPAFGVPENYNTPGETFITHVSNMLADDSKWQASMNKTGRFNVDKWLSASKALTDDGLVKGLTAIYVLMKMGYLVSADPRGRQDPYEARSPIVSGGITDDMSPRDFVVKMSELLRLQDSNTYIDNNTSNYFSGLRRRISMTQFYDGNFLPFEFGQGDVIDEQVVFSNTRHPVTGQVDTGNRNGLFLHLQLNSTRKCTAALLQAINEHTKNRIGRYVDAPNRHKRGKIVLEKGIVA